MEKYIGIIGAAGDVGRDTAKELLCLSEHKLILADIRKEETAVLASTMGTRASSMHIDVYDPDSLDEFCARCDLVVSSTGPSSLVRDKVALAALKRDLPYVDIGGSLDLYEALTEKDREIEEKGLTYMVSAGFSPGLSGTFIRYLMSPGFFDKINSCRVYLAINEKMSSTAIHDMLSGYQKRKEFGYWKQGKWIQDAGSIKFSFPLPIGEVSGKPTIEAEVRDFIEAVEPGFYAMYMCVLGKLQKLAFEFIVQQRLYETEDQKRTSAEYLARVIEYEIKDRESVLLLHAELEGKKDGKNRRLHGMVQQSKDLSFAASCAAAYVKMLAEGQVLRKGRCWASQAVEPAAFASHLKALGISIIVEEK